MNKNMEIRIRKDLRPLNKAELVEMILFLMRTSTVAVRYTLPDGYDVPEIVRVIRKKTLLEEIDRLLKENDKLQAELSELRKSPPGTSATAVGILNRLEQNEKRYMQMSEQLEKLETQ